MVEMEIRKNLENATFQVKYFSHLSHFVPLRGPRINTNHDGWTRSYYDPFFLEGGALIMDDGM